MRSRIISHSNSAKAPANSNLSRVEAGKVQFFGISKGRDTKILITPESDMSHGFLARNFGPVRLPVKKPKPPSALQFSIACMRPVARIPCAPSRRPHGLADKAQASFFTFSSATTPLSHQLLVLLFAQRARKPAGGGGGIARLPPRRNEICRHNSYPTILATSTISFLRCSCNAFINVATVSDRARFALLLIT